MAKATTCASRPADGSRGVPAERDGCRRRHVAALVVIALVALAYSFPLVFLDHVRAGNDIFKIRDPLRSAYVRALREGQLARWAPEAGVGLPLFAESQMGQLYPLHLAVFSVLDGREGDRVLEVLRCFLAGAFAYAFVWQLGAGPAGGMVAAVAFMLSGFFAVHREHMWGYATGIHLPLAMLLAERLARRGRVGTLIWLAALFGVGLLAGHFHLMFLTAALVVPYGAWRLVQERGWRWGLAGMVGLAAAVCAGAALAAVQLLPTREFAQAARPGMTARYLAAYSAPRYLPIAYLSPWVFDPDLPHWEVARTSLGETLGYVGIVPLILAAVAVATAHRRVLVQGGRDPGPGTWNPEAEPRSAEPLRRVPAVAPLTVGAVTFTLLSFGEYLPGYRWLILLPGFGTFRAPGRATFPASMCLAGLAGVGLSEWLRMGAEAAGRLWRRLAVIVPLVSLGALAAGVILCLRISATGPWPEPFNVGAAVGRVAMSWALWVPFLVAGLAALRLAARRPRVGAWALVLVAAADLTALGFEWDRRTGGTVPRRLVSGAGPVARSLGEPGTFRVAGPRDAWPILLGHRSLVFYTSFEPPGYSRLRSLAELPYGSVRDLYRAMGVRFVIAGSPIADSELREVYAGPDPAVAAQTFRPETATFHVYEVVGPVSRAQVVDEGGEVAGVCRFVADLAERVELAVTADRPGRLVLADLHDAEWTAEVNGREAPIEPVDLGGVACRSVRVSAGEQRIVFVYRPRSFVRGAWVSGAAALALVLAGTWSAAARAAVRRSRVRRSRAAG